MDYRKEWFKDRILNFFEETNPELFRVFLSRDNDSIEEQLNRFLENGADTIADISRQVFIVYKTYYSKIIQEEVEVQEEVLKQRSSSFLSQDEKGKDKRGKKKKKKKIKEVRDEDEELKDHVRVHDDVLSALEASLRPEDDEEHAHSKKKKTKKGKTGGRVSPYTMMEHLPPEEQFGKSRVAVTYVTVKKKVEKVIQVPQFQGYFGVLESDHFRLANFYVYFIKKCIGKIPEFDSAEEAISKMPFYFVVGSLTGDILQNLEKVLDLVFLPLFRNKISIPEEEMNRQVDASLKLEEIKLRRRPSYYYLRKHTDSFDLVKDELPIQVEGINSSMQLSSFVVPEEDQMWLELYGRLTNLVDILKWAQTEVKAEKKFSVPDVFLELEWENLDLNDEIIETSRTTVELWINTINKDFPDDVVHEHLNENLLQEYTYWRELELNISVVIDELNFPMVNKIADILKENHTPLYEEFIAKRANLYKKYQLQKENADVLFTLQNFFKSFMRGDFETISKIIPTVMDSLRTVWILSEYYSMEKNMERILLDIKNTLCYRVKSTFDVLTLFKRTWTDVKDDLENAILMLHDWKCSYLEVRARIESTRDYFISRWEFDKQKLFSETDYISTVVEDIKNIFEIIESYRCLFESKFRELTQNTKEFHNLKDKISNLTVPIERVDFDIYLEIFRDEWQEILDIFQQDVVDVDQRLKILIIKTFSQIKSIKEAVIVVENLSEIRTRNTVHESIPYICNKIVTFFIREINIVDTDFESNKLGSYSINIYKSIIWAANMVDDFHDTVSCLRAVESITTLSSFMEAIKLLDSFESKVKNYIKTIFKEWCAISTSLIKDTLKENVITIVEGEKRVDLKNLVERKPTGALRLCDPDEKNMQSSESTLSADNASRTHPKELLGLGALSMTLKWIARSKIMTENFLRRHKLEVQMQIEHSHKVPWLEFIGNLLLIEKGFNFRMKFQDNIFEILQEAEKLQKMNFKFPNEISELLSNKEYLIRNTDGIRDILTKYNTLIAELKPAKILFLKSYLLEVEMSIQPGLTLYSWRCTVLDTYVRKASTKLEEFSCLLYQVDQIFMKLDTFVVSIQNLHFLPVKGMIIENVKCDEFFHEIDRLQVMEVEKCFDIYTAISMTLIQLESLTLYTNSGRSELMTHYYITYGDKIINALIKSVLASILDLHLLVCGQIPVYFHMRAYLENNEIKLDPSCNELYAYVKTSLNRMFSRLKCLKEWQSGSCMTGKNSTEIFYDRLIDNEDIKARCELLFEGVENLCNSLRMSTKEWLKFSILWKHDKELTVQQFASEEPDIAEYEIRFDFYSNIVNRIEQENLIVNTLCANIEFEKLINQLKEHSFEWKHALGIQLTAYTRQSVKKLATLVKKLNTSLNTDIESDADLTETLRTIIKIQEIAGDMELEFYKINEHYHELFMQNFQVDKTDKTDFEQLKIDWQRLYDRSLYRQFSLEVVKHSRIDSMKSRIRDFMKDCESFANEYREKVKSKFSSYNFDTCIELIENYSKRCEDLCAKKEELETIQNCYEISPFDFNYFITIRNDLNALRLEYKLEQR